MTFLPLLTGFLSFLLLPHFLLFEVADPQTQNRLRSLAPLFLAKYKYEPAPGMRDGPVGDISPARHSGRRKKKSKSETTGGKQRKKKRGKAFFSLFPCVPIRTEERRRERQIQMEKSRRKRLLLVCSFFLQQRALRIRNLRCKLSSQGRAVWV